MRFCNSGKAAAVFQVRSGTAVGTPRTYTVGAGDRTDDTFSMSGATSYDLSVSAPNGFLRRFAGRLGSRGVKLSARLAYFPESESVELEIHNHGSSKANVTIIDGYSGGVTKRLLQARDTFSHFAELKETFGWYDFIVQVDSDATYRRQLAGTPRNRKRQRD